MSDAADRHAEQVAYWSGIGGRHWAEQQERTDRVMAPVADTVLEFAAVRSGETVLEVGSGAGSIAAELARRAGPAGRVVGLDVSPLLVAAARSRHGGIANLAFREGDAATEPLDDIAADLLFSRFGVMFFGNPEAAFANLRRGLKPGARVAFACWRKPAENGWMLAPLHAAYRHVPKLPELGPEDPGPFSFADPVRVERIPTRAGFLDMAMEPADLTLDLAFGGGLEQAVAFASEVGPASRAMEGQPGREAAIEAIREALAPMVRDRSVPLPAAIWLVSARNA